MRRGCKRQFPAETNDYSNENLGHSFCSKLDDKQGTLRTKELKNIGQVVFQSVMKAPSIAM